MEAPEKFQQALLEEFLEIFLNFEGISDGIPARTSEATSAEISRATPIKIS